jgi:hypothetical protein
MLSFCLIGIVIVKVVKVIPHVVQSNGAR